MNNATTSPTDQKTLVSEYINAVGDGRLAELSAYLALDVTFESPNLPRYRNRDEYTAALRRLAPIIARNEIKRVFVDGDEACVVYDFVTDTAVGPVASFEWLTIQDGQIASVFLLFDKARWSEVREELEQRAG
jgi:ketosteroid isomerase-like protein